MPRRKLRLWTVAYLKPKKWKFVFWTGKVIFGGDPPTEIIEAEYNQIVSTNSLDDFEILESPPSEPMKLIPLESKKKKKGGE